MTFIDNAKDIFTKAWSVRLNSLAAVSAVFELIQPLLQLAVPDKLFAVITGVMVVGGLLARFVKQKNLVVPADGK